MGKTGGTPVENYARWKMRLEPEVLKPLARKNFVTGLAETGNYFRAVTNIPDYISPDNQLELLTQILYTDLMKQEGKTEANSRDGKWRDDLFFAIETSQSKEYQKITESQE